MSKMSVSQLKPTSYLGEVPGMAYQELESTLNNGLWKALVSCFRDGRGRPRYSQSKINQLANSKHPGTDLLALCKRENMELQILQYYLRELNHRNLLDMIVTHVPVRVIAHTENRRCELGTDVRLTVYIEGSPEPDYTWYRNGVKCNNENSNFLVITNFSPEDQGSYECSMNQKLSDEIREIRSPRIEVAARETPPAIVKDLEEEVSLKRGDELVLCCEAVCYPAPTYSWYKNGHVLNGYTKPVLKILNVDKMVAGLYHCEVKNHVFEAKVSKVATVKVAGPNMAPVVPQILRQPQVKGAKYGLDDHVDLSFQVHCQTPVNIQCYVNQLLVADERVTCISTGNGHHTCNLHYILTKEEWFRIRKKPFSFQFLASSNGHSLLSEIVEVRVQSDFSPKFYTARNKYALLICNADYPISYRLHSPVDDSRLLAQELRKMDFRCLVCSNVNYADFKNLILLFLDFIQEGDYVVFYFAGHGFHNKGIDFLMPIDCKVTKIRSPDNIQGPPKEIVDQNECVNTTWISNQIQKCKPSLLFSILDSCRNILSPEMNLPMKNYQKYAGENSYTLYSTSEYYVSNEDGSSYLISKLLNIVGNKVSVPELCQQFKQEFSQLYAPNQVPKIEGDLVQSRSLTDPCNPTQEDKETILNEWETLAALGGIQTMEILVGNKILEINVQCVNTDLPEEGEDEVTWIIANYMTVRVWFTDHQLVENGVIVTLIFSNGQKTRERGPGVIKYDVTGLEKLKEPLKLELHLKFGIEETIVKEFDLHWPSLSKQNSILNIL